MSVSYNDPKHIFRTVIYPKRGLCASHSRATDLATARNVPHKPAMLLPEHTPEEGAILHYAAMDHTYSFDEVYAVDDSGILKVWKWPGRGRYVKCVRTGCENPAMN